MTTSSHRKLKKIIPYLFIVLFLLFLIFLFFVNRLVEPILRERMHTLIVRGSDSLYTFKLGNLKANFFGGNIEVENLQIRVDSNRYFKLLQENALPALTMQVDLHKGSIKGMGVFSLLFTKRIRIKDILSQEADIKLSRHHNKDSSGNNQILPLWKAIQPDIKSISIDKLSLDGVKLLYRNADTSESVKLQFDRCEAVFNNIKIDSAATADPDRMGFALDLNMQFYDLKFRTHDSTYKMKAELINYSSVNNELQVMDFKLQPTLEENFFKKAAVQKSSYVVQFKELKFTNFLLDRFINKNIIAADSVFIYQPDVAIANDKTLPPDMESKIGKYPHQLLMKAEPLVMIKGIKIINGIFSYTEKGEKTAREGKIVFNNMSAVFSNVTNNRLLIKENPHCIANINARVFNTSPIEAKFIFYLDSTEGEFGVQGKVRNINAEQLNKVSEPLGNIQINSLAIQVLSFQMHGDNYSSKGSVQMRYSNLVVTLKKTEEETGITKTKRFLTSILNKFTISPSNPANGVERVANNVVYARTSTKSFFGVVWKTIFYGMQNIMLKTGRYQ